MTVQTDIAMPKQQIKIAEDTVRQSAWAAAIRDAVTNIMAQDMDCRVLDLGAGSGKCRAELNLVCSKVHAKVASGFWVLPCCLAVPWHKAASVSFLNPAFMGIRDLVPTEQYSDD